MNLLYMSLVRD